MLSWFELFLSSMTFSRFRLFQIVAGCFRFSALSWLICVSVLHVFGCFKLVLGSDGVVLRLP